MPLTQGEPMSQSPLESLILTPQYLGQWNRSQTLDLKTHTHKHPQNCTMRLVLLVFWALYRFKISLIQSSYVYNKQICLQSKYSW